MNKIHKLLLIALATFTISLVRAADDEAIKKDLAQLQGEWTIVSASADGQSMSEDMLKQMKRVCKGDEITVTMGDQIFLKAKITIDPSKKPKTIDYDMTEGYSKGKKQLGDDEISPLRPPLPPGTTNYITREGAERLDRRLKDLIAKKQLAEVKGSNEP